MHSLIDAIMSYFGSIDYASIFVLMTLESSIFPVPSEIVMIPAGISAVAGHINPWLAILVGGLGSLVGALLNYYILGRFLGRPFLERYGKYILITPDKYKKADDLFIKNDRLYTFVGRFIPVVRHLISIPAGIFGMPIGLFSLLTFAGATIWCGILVALGYFFGPSTEVLLGQYSNQVGIACLVVFGLYVWYKVFKK